MPYRGAAQQVTDVLGNNVTATFASYLAVSSFVEAGQVKALAVTSSERIPSLPSVPAMAEHPQLKGYDVTNWFGLFAPRRYAGPHHRQAEQGGRSGARQSGDGQEAGGSRQAIRHR